LGNNPPGEIISFGGALYVATSTGAIFAYSLNPDGSLTAVAGSPFAAGTGLSQLAALVSFADGNTAFLYGANTADANGSISAFGIGPSGGLTPVAGSPFPTVAGSGPAGFYAGKFLYVALKNSNSVAAFKIADDGSLTSLRYARYAFTSEASSDRAATEDPEVGTRALWPVSVP
jgi:hypothetical protein